MVLKMSDAMSDGRHAVSNDHLFVVFLPYSTIKCNYLEIIKQFPDKFPANNVSHGETHFLDNFCIGIAFL